MVLGQIHLEEIAMGSEKDVIFTYAERSLKRKFPSNEGWQIQRMSASKDFTPDYVVARKWQGFSQYALASVFMKSQLLESDIPPSLSQDSGEHFGSLIGRVVIVPAGADSSSVPGEIDVLELKGYVCQDDDIIWLKRTLPFEENED
jgi:hypothetical protein